MPWRNILAANTSISLWIFPLAEKSSLTIIPSRLVRNEELGAQTQDDAYGDDDQRDDVGDFDVVPDGGRVDVVVGTSGGHNFHFLGPVRTSDLPSFLSFPSGQATCKDSERAMFRSATNMMLAGITSSYVKCLHDSDI